MIPFPRDRVQFADRTEPAIQVLVQVGNASVQLMTPSGREKTGYCHPQSTTTELESLSKTSVG